MKNSTKILMIALVGLSVIDTNLSAMVRRNKAHIDAVRARVEKDMAVRAAQDIADTDRWLVEHKDVIAEGGRGRRVAKSTGYAQAAKPREMVRCYICYEDVDFDNTYALSCEHRFCKACLEKYIQVKYENNRVLLDQTVCPKSGSLRDFCKTIISRQEMADITKNDAKILTAYDASTPWLKENAHKNVRMDKGVKNAGAQACPQCSAPILKNEGCNHMTCGQCKHEFCWLCLGPYYASGSSGFTARVCGCPAYGDPIAYRLIRLAVMPIRGLATVWRNIPTMPRFGCDRRKALYLAGAAVSAASTLVAQDATTAGASLASTLGLTALAIKR